MINEDKIIETLSKDLNKGFNLMKEEYKYFVNKLVTSFVDNKDYVLCITKDVYRNIFKELKSIKNIKNLTTLVYKITMNTCISNSI